MKNFFDSICNYAKTFFENHRKLLKRLLIVTVSTIAVAALLFGFCFVYFRAQYPEEMDLSNAYYDIEALNLTFSERDTQTQMDVSDAETIRVQDNQILSDKDIAIIENNRITLSTAGIYIFSGELTDGSIVVDAGETDKLQLILDGFNLSNSQGPAICIRSADKVFITTKAGTTNTLTDGEGYSLTDGDTNVDGTIFSKADLTLNGLGTLIVKGNTAHAVVSKDDLVVASGTYEIESVKKGICGKDCVKISEGFIQIEAGTDGLCSDNAEDATRGFVYIKDGDIQIRCGNDGIQAQNALICDAPTISITSRGGADCAPVKEGSHGKGKREQDANEETENTTSAKGLKSVKDILLYGGTYTIDSFDDAVHSDHSIKVENGSFTIKSGDDAFHAEHTLEVLDGTVNIEQCFEGLEGYQITINGGEITVVSSDDGVNASSGSGAQSRIKGFFDVDSLGKLEMTGGQLSVLSGGDSLDSNGTMRILGGTVLASGPSGHGDGIFDCDDGAVVDGGTVLCVGSMQQGTTKADFTGSDEYFRAENQLQIVRSTGWKPAGTQLELYDSQGKQLAVYAVPQQFNYIIASAPEFQAETDCIIKIDGKEN